MFRTVLFVNVNIMILLDYSAYGSAKSLDFYTLVLAEMWRCIPQTNRTKKFVGEVMTFPGIQICIISLFTMMGARPSSPTLFTMLLSLWLVGSQGMAL